MKKVGNNDYEIANFGQKLMAVTKSLNKSPEEFLAYSQNARIYDGAIGPRKGNIIHTNSNIGTKNKGAFLLKNKLYQITNGKIYEVDDLGKQKEMCDLGYDAKVSIATYNSEFTIIACEGQRLRIFDGKNLKFSTRDSFATLEFKGIHKTENTPAQLLGVEVWGNTSYASGYIKEIDNGKRTLKVSATGNVEFIEGEDLRLLNTINNVEDVFKEIKVLERNYIKGGVIELAIDRCFVAEDNILYVSKRLQTTDSSVLYDFTGKDCTKAIICDSKILGLKRCLRGMYVFTEKTIELLTADSFKIEEIGRDGRDGEQEVGITSPIGDGGVLADNNLVVTAGDIILYYTKSQGISLINYVPGTTIPGIGGEISSEPLVGIKDLLSSVDIEQESGFAYFNQSDNNVQFFLRTFGSIYNNICIVYDLINFTWNIDTNKNYNYIINHNGKHFAFSDINSSIYLDSIGMTDNGDCIDFKILTPNYNFYSNTQKLFQGFISSGFIGIMAELSIKVYIDEEIAYEGIINGKDFLKRKNSLLTIKKLLDSNFGTPLLEEVGGLAIGSEISPDLDKYPFYIKVDAGNINLSGEAIRIEFSSKSFLSDFLIGTLAISKIDLDFVGMDNKI